METEGFVIKNMINRFNNLTIRGYEEDYLFGNIFQAS